MLRSKPALSNKSQLKLLNLIYIICFYLIEFWQINHNLIKFLFNIYQHF